jgi:serine/threonine protein kinase
LVFVFRRSPEALVAEQNIGNYRLVKLLGNGQTSQVWEVVEMTSNRHFAMKVLSSEYSTKADARNALFHEADVGLQMAQANVIKIFSVSKEKAAPHYIMEFFPAGSLKARLQRKEFDFVKKNMRSILKQAATGLAYVNASGWVHCDVKPDNFLVNAACELRIIDFALAKRVEKENFFTKFFRKKGMVQGTRSYMSPEQILGQPLDGRADIYSFAATMYELTTNRPPFRGATQQELLRKHISEKPVSPQQLAPELSDEFSKLVLRMLEKKREDRPETFHDVMIAMNQMKIYKNEPARTSS